MDRLDILKDNPTCRWSRSKAFLPKPIEDQHTSPQGNNSCCAMIYCNKLRQSSLLIDKYVEREDQTITSLTLTRHTAPMYT